MRIAIFTPGNGHALEACGPGDVFAEANQQGDLRPRYELQFIGEDTSPIRCLSGLQLLPDSTIATPDEPLDTLIVAGPHGVPPPATPELIAWLQRRTGSARRYGSVCTGAFLLGAAGLLDGKHVTTHWRHARELAIAYPAAIVDMDRIFVRDGQLFTSAGVASGIDLALALVEEDHGRELALAVARQLVVFLKRSGGQSQFSAPLAAQIATRTPIQLVQSHVLEHPAERLSVTALSRLAGMSERNFSRVFRKEAGMTPADFVEGTRVDMARRLLEETALPLQRIAQDCGFGSSDTLRRAFMRRLGVNPLEYRLRFRSAVGAKVA